MDFINAKSKNEFEHIKGRVDRERTIREDANRLGGLTQYAASFLGSVTNPVYLVPGVASSLPGFIAAETLLEAGNEVLLQSQQYERTMAESAMNIFAAGAFGGALGSVKKFGSKVDINEGEKAAKKILFEKEEVLDPIQVKGSAGAAEVPVTIEDESMVGGKVAEALSIGPMGRLLSSPSIKVRQLAQMIARNPFLMKKHEKGMVDDPSIEAKIDSIEGRMANVLFDTNRHWQQHRKNGGKLTSAQFNREVGKALSYGDRSLIPEVQDAVYANRHFYDGMKEWAIKAGRMTPDEATKFAESYFPRVYNRRALIEGADKFVKMLQDHVARGIRHNSLAILQGPKSRIAIPASRLEAFQKANPGFSVLTRPLDETGIESQAFNIATQVHRDLVFHSRDPYAHNVGEVSEAGALQERTLGLSDRQLEAFLEKRSDVVIKHHTREMAFDLASFDKLGEVGLDTELTHIRNESERLLTAEKDPKKRAKIAKRLDEDTADLRKLYETVAGKFGRPDDWNKWHTAGAAVRTFSNLTKMGGVVLTSIPDLARVPMKVGFMPFIKGMKNVITKRNNLSPSAKRDIGVAIDRVTNGRMRSIADLGDDPRDPTRELNDIFFHVSMMNHWTDFMQSISAEAVSMQFIRWAKTGKNKTALARAGIDEQSAKRILQMQEATKSLDPRVWEQQPEHWAEDVADVWRAAINSEVKHTIIEPGAGDVPFIARTEGGKFFFQFKSFMFAAHNKMLISGLQQNDANMYAGLIFAGVLGGLVSEAKDRLRGHESDKDAAEKVFNAVDRTGFYGVFGVPMGYAYKLAGGQHSRMVGQNLTSMLAGPNIGTAEDLITTGTKALRGEDIDPDKLARQIPFANVMHFKDMVMRLAE